jgi:GntR family transcriptional regulator
VIAATVRPGDVLQNRDHRPFQPRPLAHTFSEISRSRTARYLQLASLFRGRIASGQWPVGHRIPNVIELADEFQVARGTIREAMGVLDAEGLVERLRAKGSFVRRTPAAIDGHRLESDWNAIIAAHAGGEIKVLEHARNVQPPSHLTHDAALVGEYEMMRRLHLRDRVPYLLGRFYLDRELYRLAPAKRYRKEATLRILHEVAGERIAQARQTLTIGTADLEVSRLLEVPLNSPVAVVHRVAYDHQGRLAYLGEGLYRGDAVKLEIELR